MQPIDREYITQKQNNRIFLVIAMHMSTWLVITSIDDDSFLKIMDYLKSSVSGTFHFLTDPVPFPLITDPVDPTSNF